MSRTKGKAEFVKWVPLLLDALRALGGSAESRDVIDLNLQKRQRKASCSKFFNRYRLMVSSASANDCFTNTVWKKSSSPEKATTGELMGRDFSA
jgi:hypothetical protein